MTGLQTVGFDLMQSENNTFTPLVFSILACL